MSCNCKETRKVKSCPTASVEETILTELRNFYEYVVAKFVEVLGILNTAKPALAYVFGNSAVAADGSTAYFTTPTKMVTLVVEVTGLPLVEDPDAIVRLVAPGGIPVWEFHENGKIELPVADLYHMDPNVFVGWGMKVVGTFAGPVYPTVAYKHLTIAEA